MSGFLTRERFGSAQAIATVILLAFLGQCLWFCARAPLTDREIAFVLQGERQWAHQAASPHEPSSPITSLVAALPLVGSHANPDEIPAYWRWFARAPFMILGLLYGASIWYVARRLYGNVAGYMALVLYAFSPFFVIHSSTVQPEVIAGWGAFGIIFTAIGVAHSLYAPREVVLWNWKRILLLGVALGLGCAAQGMVIILVPVALAFMWYLVPERRAAATVIMLAACAVGGIIFLGVYGFHAANALHAIVPGSLAPVESSAFSASVTWSWIGAFFVRQQPTVTLLLLISLVTFALWKRARFFGTAAPLIVFLILVFAAIAMPAQGAFPFYLIAMPFAFVFISGVMTDILESRYAPISLGVVLGILIGHIVISISGLLRM